MLLMKIFHLAWSRHVEEIHGTNMPLHAIYKCMQAGELSTYLTLVKSEHYFLLHGFHHFTVLVFAYICL